MKAYQWIDLVKVYRQWESDYRAAKELGLSRNTISMYRSRTPTMDEETAVLIADALEINPATVLLDQVAERSKSEVVKEALSDCHIATPDDVMTPGYTAQERAQIRAEINELGVGALHLPGSPARKRKTTAGLAGVVFAGMVAAGFITTTPNAHATVTAFDAQKSGSLYIMFSFLRSLFRRSKAARFGKLAGPQQQGVPNVSCASAAAGPLAFA